MSFERYMAAQIEEIAQTGEPSDPEFEQRLKIYLKMIQGGMSAKAAKAVMDWYTRE